MVSRSIGRVALLLVTAAGLILGTVTTTASAATTAPAATTLAESEGPPQTKSAWPICLVVKPGVTNVNVRRAPWGEIVRQIHAGQKMDYYGNATQNPAGYWWVWVDLWGGERNVVVAWEFLTYC